uniref:Uncharacterized protein n=1 Tax=Rhizophora mucronata TaxID=61149 RepID=A0A2P2QA17_RHIMU
MQGNMQARKSLLLPMFPNIYPNYNLVKYSIHTSNCISQSIT